MVSAARSPAPEVTAPMEATFSTVQVCDLADLSYRQVDYWVRSGYFPEQRPGCSGAARGSGTRRRWTEHEVAVARVLGRIAGLIPIGRLADLSGLLHSIPVDAWPERLIVDRDGQAWHPDDDAPEVGIHVAVKRLGQLPALVS